MRRVALIVVVLAVAVLAGGCTWVGGQQPTRLSAVFDNTSNLFVGSEVRVLGLQVGEVTDITPRGQVVEVEMLVDADRPLPADVSAHLVPSALLGERFVQLDPPYTDGPELTDGAVIGNERTTQPAEIDEVLASFERFLESLDREALADLFDSLAGTLAGQGEGLNELVDEATETTRVLADSSGDLNAVVAEFGDLNATLATRDERIGSTLDELSTTLSILVEERDEIIGTVAELHRLTAELRPLLDEHGDELVTDLEQLTTTLSTVERNLERLGDATDGARQLFTGMGEAINFETAQLDLHNETDDVGALAVERVVQRLVGLCLRLEIAECSDASFFAEAVHDSASDREDLLANLGEVIAELIRALPEEAQDELGGEVPGAPHPEDGDGGSDESEPGPLPERDPDDAPDGGGDAPTDELDEPDDPEDALDELLEDPS